LHASIETSTVPPIPILVVAAAAAAADDGAALAARPVLLVGAAFFFVLLGAAALALAGGFLSSTAAALAFAFAAEGFVVAGFDAFFVLAADVAAAGGAAAGLVSAAAAAAAVSPIPDPSFPLGLLRVEIAMVSLFSFPAKIGLQQEERRGVGIPSWGPKAGCRCVSCGSSLNGSFSGCLQIHGERKTLYCKVWTRDTQRSDTNKIDHGRPGRFP
jgi:hypothetical protein